MLKLNFIVLSITSKLLISIIKQDGIGNKDEKNDIKTYPHFLN